MSFRLVITEKPSVAASIAKVIGAKGRKDGYFQGGEYLVSWCVGHLVELAMPQAYDEKYGKWRKEDLPILPGKWKYEISQSTKKQFQVLKSLMARSDVTELICATDAGREGELIFRLVYHQAGCKKPFRRLWISSMEDSAIREGFSHLKSSAEYDALYDAALCRERADWIIGMNASRLYSILYGPTFNIGRVVTPTLSMLVEREQSIKNFVPELFYTVQIQAGGAKAASKRYKEKTQVDELAERCRKDHQVKVDSVVTKEKTEKPLQLYDLTSLQRDANKMLGLSAQQTLDALQALYEKKLVTYPRTDSRYLTENMASSLPGLIEMAAAAIGYTDAVPVHAAQVINSSKVTDHHAVIPTRELDKAKNMELSQAESDVLKLVAVRFMAAVGDPCRYQETAISLTCAGETFTVKGKVMLHPGWKAITKHFYPVKEKEAEAIPDLQEGTILPLANAEVKEGKTKPAQHFTEGSLLCAMETAGAEDIPDEAERKGLGTPATRAGIIEKLIKRGYAVRSGDKKTKLILPTDKGESLIAILPEKLKSPMMTAEWEQKLLQVERKNYDPDRFMDEISAFVRELVDTAEVDPSISFAPSFPRKTKKGRKR